MGLVFRIIYQNTSIPPSWQHTFPSPGSFNLCAILTYSGLVVNWLPLNVGAPIFLLAFSIHKPAKSSQPFCPAPLSAATACTFAHDVKASGVKQLFRCCLVIVSSCNFFSVLPQNFVIWLSLYVYIIV